MKIDTSQPKDWNKFICDLGVTGIEKLLISNCRVDIWEFPLIVLTIEEAKQPFICRDRIEHLKVKIGDYYERNCLEIDLRIFTRKEGQPIYNYDRYIAMIRETRAKALEEIKGKIKLEPKAEEKYLGLCPFHEEKTPSFMVNMKSGMWNCFGCGAYGTMDHLCKIIDASNEGKKMKEEVKEYKPEPPIERQILSVLNHMAASFEGIEYELYNIKEAIFKRNIK